VQTDDIIEYGMIPELVGRLPVVAPLTPLDRDGLIKVLSEPKNSLVKQYQTLFEMENCELSFTPAALHSIATKALEKNVGARGLRSIIENVMLDIMYELPDQPPGNKWVINEDVIAGRQKLFVPEPQSKSA
jgi:ATP-dependent Clp protease ATP-binding subunit ClpX